MITEQYSTCLHANRPFCKIDAPFHALTNPSTCITALYTKNDQEIEAQCSLSILKTPPTFLPIVISSNLWNFISTLTTQGSTIAMICPDKVTSLPPFQKPFHSLRLLPACSTTSRYFNLSPHYKDHMMTICITLDKANPVFFIGNTSAATGPQINYGNWWTHLRSQLYNSIST